MNKRTMMKAELQGRLPIIWALQMEDPDAIVTSMPLHCKYDLQVMRKDGTEEYIEIKDRTMRSTEIQTVMVNEEKVAANSTYGPDFFFVSSFSDGMSIWFQPDKMPDSGITEAEVYIKKVQMDPSSPKTLQKRLFYNINDASRKIRVPHITIDDDE